MQIFDVPWISHDGGNIFSLDIHTNGTKLATAGQDGGGAGLLVIWNLDFISSNLSSDLATHSECNYSPLARIPHSSSINCVRWSKHSDGRRLVCAGDDSVLCIYECTGIYSSMGSIDEQNTSCSNRVKRNVESYRCTHKLFGHTLDVMHLDFSPDGKYLASCSLDNSIIIWNALKLPEKITVLKESNGGHRRGVKGFSWDPVGRFLATQSEDNSLKIWQTDSWSCIQTFTEPFAESAISTLFYRMDWSPDGCYLVAPCAMNNGGPTAKIFVRQDWSYSRDLVGFRKAVACVRSNPHCFQRTNSSGTHSTLSCFAIGSRDRSLSVWLIPNFGRPLMVIERLFKDSLIDLSWSKLMLAACSRDGMVRILKFSDNEIGHMLSAQETSTILGSLYGIRPHFGPSSNFSSKTSAIGEISADFGYTSICEAILTRARRTTIAEPEFFQIAFNQDAPKKRLSNELLQRFAQRAKRQRLNEQRNSFSTKHPSSHKPMDDQTDERQQRLVNEYGNRQRAEFRLYEKIEGGEVANKEDEHIFEVPEKRRLLIVRLSGKKEENDSIKVDSVEMLNNYPLKSHAESEIARIAAYKAKMIDLPSWTFFCYRIVSILAANRKWTILATFDSHFLVLSTQTGCLIFDVILDEPLASIQLQSGEHDIALTLGIGGALSVWDLANGTRAVHSQIRTLIKHSNQQLISTVAKKLPNGQVTAQVLFSDLNLYAYSHKLNGWLMRFSLLDLHKSSNLPANIISMLIPNAISTTTNE